MMYTHIVITDKEEKSMTYMDYIKALINFIMNLISLFKKSENTEGDESDIA